MWPFKKKKNEEIKEAQEAETYEEMIERKNTTTLSVLDEFDEPWQILKCTSFKKLCYEIYVFNLVTSSWENLNYKSKQILGIERKEYTRLMTEVFGADDYSGYDYPTFKTIEAAQKAVDEFKPYYDSYHTPRAIMERLSFYDEGSYPPYFGHHVTEDMKLKIGEDDEE